MSEGFAVIKDKDIKASSRGIDAIKDAFTKAKEEKRSAFIPFITAGDPNILISEELILALSDAGADIIELGVPFSDPVADGPTIQASSQRALKNGITPEDVLTLVRKVREKGCMTPIVLMGYYNPVLQYGLSRFAEKMVEVGADGTIIADLPIEEAHEWRRIASINGLANIFLVAPTTPISRARFIAEASTGFLYYVSVTGITGARTELPEHLQEALRQVKAVSPVPVGVGFGISTPEQVKMLSRIADGIIVGSAIIRVIQRHVTEKDIGFEVNPNLVEDVKKFISELVKAI